MYVKLNSWTFIQVKKRFITFGTSCTYLFWYCPATGMQNSDKVRQVSLRQVEVI